MNPLYRVVLPNGHHFMFFGVESTAFAGSERHLLEDIFNDPIRPFYNSVVFMQLLPIEKQEYIAFCHRMFALHQNTFEDRFASLTEKQKAVMLAIAAEYPNNYLLTNQDFIAKYNLKSASSIQTAVKGLTDKGILSSYHGMKRPSDLLFVLWLKNF